MSNRLFDSGNGDIGMISINNNVSLKIQRAQQQRSKCDHIVNSNLAMTGAVSRVNKLPQAFLL
jgi:hypothetical protein